MAFNEEERQFLKDLSNCNNDRDYKELQDKHGQEKFNHLKHRVKDKAQQMRTQIKRDLELYEKVEDVLMYYL